MKLQTFAHFIGLPDEPPREFRIFKAGVNDSSKGPALFDDIAAQNVMNAWKKWGVRLIVDLQHHSLLEGDKGAFAREDAEDARGHFDLEVRPGPELWAVNVRWNADGERRIRERLQTYISPAFSYDDDGRPTELVNAALVSMPATHGAQPLIAASRKKSSEIDRAITLARKYFAPGDPGAIQPLIRELRRKQRSKQNANS